MSPDLPHGLRHADYESYPAPSGRPRGTRGRRALTGSLALLLGAAASLVVSFAASAEGSLVMALVAVVGVLVATRVARRSPWRTPVLAAACGVLLALVAFWVVALVRAS